MTLCDAYMPITVSYISDRWSLESWGRRKPFIVVGVSIMAVANLGLVTARGGSNSTLGIAYVSFGTISYFGTSIQQTALDAFRLELCTSENEFVKCISIYDLLACLLAAIVAIGTYLVDPWACTVCGLVTIAIAGYYLIFRLTVQDTVKADIKTFSFGILVDFFN